MRISPIFHLPSSTNPSSHVHRHAVRPNRSNDSLLGVSPEIRSGPQTNPLGQRCSDATPDRPRILAAEAQLPDSPQDRSQTTGDPLAMIAAERGNLTEVRIAAGAEVAHHLIVLSGH